MSAATSVSNGDGENAKAKLLRELQEAESRLAGEKKAIASLLHEQDQKQGQMVSMAALLVTQNNCQKEEAAFHADVTRHEAERLKYELEIADDQVRCLQGQQDYYKRVRVENEALEGKAKELMEKHVGLYRYHAMEAHNINAAMLRFRKRTEGDYCDKIMEFKAMYRE